MLKLLRCSILSLLPTKIPHEKRYQNENVKLRFMQTSRSLTPSTKMFCEWSTFLRWCVWIWQLSRTTRRRNMFLQWRRLNQTKRSRTAAGCCLCPQCFLNQLGLLCRYGATKRNSYDFPNSNIVGFGRCVTASLWNLRSVVPEIHFVVLFPWCRYGF